MSVFSKLLLFLLILVMNTLHAKADCNFIYAKYLTELNNPKNIKKIDIKIPKSSKYIINFYKIIGSDSENIPPELRKTFRANLTVHYKFGGSCTYKAKIRQNGDWRDHIDEDSGLRSLKVNLKEGNVLNSVKFKLLLPVTRNNLHEILGSIILKELGFISPETFQVKVDINGTNGLMLFQEDSQKELLEKNKRIEGPIFEGDESLLWARNRFKHIHEKILLSKMVNQKWFVKNKNSKKITLSAYTNLQLKYLEYSQNISKYNWTLIFPNNKESEIFEDYLFMMLSMNGKHGLRPHNRKYYFNSFISQFEPIYYDGDFKLTNKINIELDAIKLGFKKNYKFKKLDKFNNNKFINNLFELFNNRIEDQDNNSKEFFYKSISQINNNAANLQLEIDKYNFTNHQINSDFFYKKNVASYLASLKQLKLKQNNIYSIRENNGKYKINLINNPNQSILVNEKNLMQIISSNKFGDDRFTFLTDKIDYRKLKIKDLIKINILNGTIIHSPGINLKISLPEKTILIDQSNSNDWILFKNVDLSNWNIFFNGSIKKNNFISKETKLSRFNDHGLTGCLTLYKSKLFNTNFDLQNGACEDILNINNSYGHINEIKIKNALFDALDADFSNIKINQINIFKAANDCVDFSAGIYSVDNLTLSNCGDKGVSVGEKSNFYARNMKVENSGIGISSKDQSTSTIENANFKKNKNCYEVAKKKQEFGGAKISFNSVSCNSKFIQDQNSIIEITSK
jgi:hypothetical protein